MKILIYSAVFLVMPFIFAGIINNIKSFWAGRQGPPLLQPFFDFVKFLKKGRVISVTSGGIFAAAPVAGAAAALIASVVVPVSGSGSLFSFGGDFIFFAYILALGKFFMIASSMETGSSFEGMGASREAFFSALVEPSFFIIFASLSAFSGHLSFSGIFAFIRTGEPLMTAIIILCAASLYVTLLTEGCRVPVDDPNTHLELTMIHEVMVLDNSGPDMALINYASWLKMTMFSVLISGIIIDPSTGAGISLAITLVIIVAAAVITGCIESMFARLRMTHVPQFLLLTASIAVAVLSIAVLVIFGGLK